MICCLNKSVFFLEKILSKLNHTPNKVDNQNGRVHWAIVVLNASIKGSKNAYWSIFSKMSELFAALLIMLSIPTIIILMVQQNYL